MDNQVGKEDPQGERRWNPKNRSWGVMFVAVESKDLIECSTFGRRSPIEYLTGFEFSVPYVHPSREYRYNVHIYSLYSCIVFYGLEDMLVR